MTKEMRRQLYWRFNKVLEIFHTGTAILLDFRFKQRPFADKNNVKAVEERLVEMMRGSCSGDDERFSQWRWWGFPAVEMMRGSYSGDDEKFLQWRWEYTGTSVAEREAEEEGDSGEMGRADDFQSWENFARGVKSCQKTALVPVARHHIEIRRHENEPLISRKDHRTWCRNHCALFPMLQNYTKNFFAYQEHLCQQNVSSPKPVNLFLKGDASWVATSLSWYCL